MTTSVTVLVDNLPGNVLEGEWGLSLLVKHGEKTILADAGASELFAENARRLGINLADVDYATLSHAHYDHSGGIPRFFRENRHAAFYLQEGTAEDCYAGKFIFHRYIGIPRGILSDYSERIRFVSGKYRLCDGVWLIGHSTPGLAVIGKREHMYRRTAKGWRPDDFSHEQSLVLETERGLLVINCCSHGGVANILRETSEAFPGHKVYGILGGFHLFNKSADEIRTIGRDIAATGIDFVCTGHCTRDRAYGILQQELGERLQKMHVGLTLDF